MARRVKSIPEPPKDRWSEIVEAFIDCKEAVHYVFRTKYQKAE